VTDEISLRAAFPLSPAEQVLEPVPKPPWFPLLSPCSTRRAISAAVWIQPWAERSPVFVDIEDETFNLDLTDLRGKITPHTRAIMAVDVFGHPAEWDAIEELADQYQLKVIDDSCEALGAEYKGRKVGQFGNASAFAFYPNKQMTTGEGGSLRRTIPKLLAHLGAWQIRHEVRWELGLSTSDWGTTIAWMRCQLRWGSHNSDG
jgi:hypothetical protein